MVILTEQIEIPAPYEKLEAWVANFEEEFVKWSPTTSNVISITGTITQEARFASARLSWGWTTM